MTRKHTRAPFAHLTWEGRENVNPAPPATLQLWSQAAEKRSGKGFQPGLLIEGDNLGVMSALLADYREQVDLIYVDPPFLTGRAYRSRIGQGEDSRQPAEWKTTPGYADTWQDGAAYLNMLYPRLKLMHALLSPRGSLYMHLDWHMSAYARVLLDEIFGHGRLLNEIVWVYHGPSPIRSAFKRKHDTILLYTKSDKYTFNADEVRIPYNESTLKTFASSEKAGFGKKPQLDRGKVPEDWWYFPVVARLHAERTGYPTQKPEALIERMLAASSNPGDLVADFFSGSATTAVVASRLKRNWIACDPAPMASLTSYRRLLLQEPMPAIKWLRAEPIGQPALELDASVRTENNRTVVRLRDGKTTAGQPLTFPGELVLWEVGTSTEGGAMNVIAWSVRDFRGGELALETSFDAVTDGRDLRIRVYDCYGRWGECRPASDAAAE